MQWLKKYPNKLIFACAETNIAVNNLYKEFIKHDIKAIRIGQNTDEINDYF